VRPVAGPESCGLAREGLGALTESAWQARPIAARKARILTATALTLVFTCLSGGLARLSWLVIHQPGLPATATLTRRPAHEPAAPLALFERMSLGDEQDPYLHRPRSGRGPVQHLIVIPSGKVRLSRLHSG